MQFIISKKRLILVKNISIKGSRRGRRRKIEDENHPFAERRKSENRR